MRLEEAILAVLLHRSPDSKFGRTKLMKVMYFLKEEGGLAFDAEFDLYTWGPYSQEVLSGLNSLTASPGGAVEETGSAEDGYDLKVNATGIGGQTALDEQQLIILNSLKDLPASELEAKSTLHLICKRAGISDRDAVVQRVKRIKPYFRIAELNQYWSDLEQLGWVKTQPAAS